MKWHKIEVFLYGIVSVFVFKNIYTSQVKPDLPTGRVLTVCFKVYKKFITVVSRGTFKSYHLELNLNNF